MDENVERSVGPAAANCCEQDRILKVFNLVDWKEVPKLGELSKECDQLHRRLEAFEQQVSRINERNEKIEADIKDIKGHIQNKKEKMVGKLL